VAKKIRSTVITNFPDGRSGTRIVDGQTYRHCTIERMRISNAFITDRLPVTEAIRQYPNMVAGLRAECIANNGDVEVFDALVGDWDHSRETEERFLADAAEGKYTKASRKPDFEPKATKRRHAFSIQQVAPEDILADDDDVDEKIARALAFSQMVGELAEQWCKIYGGFDDLEIIERMLDPDFVIPFKYANWPKGGQASG
jgi:hypothetical protein